MNFNAKSKLQSTPHLKIIASYWFLFAYCIGAALIVRLFTPALPAVVWLSFSGVILASILISWGAETAQFLVSQGLAIAFIALLQVVPEFMVEATVAWRGETELMLANVTGSNRLLMGVGWSMVFIVADVASRLRTGHGIPYIELRRETYVQVLMLMVSSGYFAFVIWHGRLDIVDGVFLLAFFAVYMILLKRLPEEDAEKKEDLLTMPRYLATIPRLGEQIYKLIGVFIVGGITMWAMAEPFLDSIKVIAAGVGITAFVFIQWIAPFLSEFPETVTAFYWARRIEPAPMALMNLISSKVSQWTLLVAMIPVVFLATHGRWEIQLTVRQNEELFLSLMMMLYGGVTLLKLRFTRLNALSLFVLWLVQFIFPSRLPWLGETGWNDTRFLVAGAFSLLLVVELVKHRNDLHVLENVRWVAAAMK
jgi:cation:H+ antiporter